MSELTGRIRYRDGRFGGLVLQVEYHKAGLAGRLCELITEAFWRDADWSDLMELQTQQRPPRERIFGVGRKEPIVTHASNQPHHPRS